MFATVCRGTERESRISQRGSVFAEAIIVLPLILLVLFGIIQYGLILSAHITLRNASAAAVRAARLDGADDAGVRQAARDALQPMLDGSVLQDDDIVIGSPTVNGEAASRITLNYDLPLLLPFVVPGSSGGVYTISASSTMR